LGKNLYGTVLKLDIDRIIDEFVDVVENLLEFVSLWNGSFFWFLDFSWICFWIFWVWLEQSLGYGTWGLIRFGPKGQAKLEKQSTKSWEKWSTKCRETGVQSPEKSNLPSCTKAS